MKLFKNNPFKIKRPLTHGEQINSARLKGDVAVSLFKTAHTQLEEANKELQAIHTDAVLKVQELNRHIEAAETEIRMNVAVQSKLKDFIN